MVKYVIISPVRNEEDYIKLTLDSVVNQSVIPTEWIIVDDGSTDSTEEIIKEYQTKYNWITLLKLKDRGFYFPGTGVVNVFNKGFEQIKTKDWQYVVKLDCDLKFEGNYFESVFNKFEQNPKLGIASGCTYLPLNGKWVLEKVQEDHPVGPSKIYKRECWVDFGGLLPVPGWDLADLLSAQMKGWETARFNEFKIEHYRLTGSRRKGVWAPKHLQGRFEYRHGYSFGYSFMKALKNSFSKPILIGSLAKITGYMNAYLKKEDFLFPKDMRKFLREKHKGILKEKLKRFSGK